MTVDLSDTNRPTNLADRFSELYDNEWTKALDDLNKVKEEHEDGNIKLLADILEVQSKWSITNHRQRQNYLLYLQTRVQINKTDK